MTIIVQPTNGGVKTALQIMQEFCKRTALPVPQFILSNTDAQVVQLLALMNEEMDDLVGRFNWPQLVVEATFAATGVENQGALETLFPGFKSLVKDTLWSTTRRLQSIGSLSGQNTQAIKSLGNPASSTLYRLVGGQLHFVPGTNIAAGDTYRTEYNSKYGVTTETTGVAKDYFSLDGDTPKLPDSLITLGLRWRWRCAKGLDYAENFRLYEERVKQAFIDSRDAQTLSMNHVRTAKPGIVIPQGNWPS